MTFFTPIINFDFVQPHQWVKISKLKIKSISDTDFLNYFGAKRIFDENGRLTSLKLVGKKHTNIRALRHANLSALNEFQKAKLLECKYAFVSNLDATKHGLEVYNILNALRLFKLNGIICPVTFDDDNKQINLYFMYPIESKIKGKTILTRLELKKVEKILSNLPEIDSEDIKLLSLVVEQGISILSLVFLVIILERSIMKGDQREIIFKVKLYAAKLLSKCFKYKEKEVFDIINTAYRLRSKFVHSAKTPPDDEINKIFPHLYDYTIKILKVKAQAPDLLSDKNRNKLLLSIR